MHFHADNDRGWKIQAICLGVSSLSLQCIMQPVEAPQRISPRQLYLEYLVVVINVLVFGRWPLFGKQFQSRLNHFCIYVKGGSRLIDVTGTLMSDIK